MPIKEIYLMTNRNTLFFDENEEQLINLQETINWRPIPSYESYKVESVLKQIIKDRPNIYISRWMNWTQEISLEEFISLIGFGPWYWDYKKEQEHDQTDQSTD